MEKRKPIHTKPSFYAMTFGPIKEIGLEYGYNIVLHGSLNRDMDLIAIPWQEEVGSVDEMIDEICEYIGGKVMLFNKTRDESGNIIGDRFTDKPHGRKAYVIDIYRGGYEKSPEFNDWGYHKDPQTYLDISVIPTITK